MKRHTWAYLIALMVIVAVTVDRIEDSISDDEHKIQIEKFMSAGGRNTSSMGKALCKSNNQTRAILNLKEDDCEAIYVNADKK